MSEYKDGLTAAMLELSADPKVCFVGYGVKIGGRANGTLKNVRDEQLIETPVAENLMAGLAIGLSLAGRKPVVFIERFDFILNALDAIVNHLDKMALMSGGQFQPAIILRVVVGNQTKPLFTGVTHTQDFSAAMRQLLTFPVIQLRANATNDQIQTAYKHAHADLINAVHTKIGWPAVGAPSSTMIVEYKDHY